jgi:predicted Rossmann fold nucleotide-binding protein DprA/Smf involved in DNA uptake
LANIAVLAAGAGAFSPPSNEQLFKELLNNGGSIITEYPPNTIPYGWRFLERNRLIAALSKATIVTEAPWRSGALSTAAHARQFNKPVGAVPGSIKSFSSSGCNKLISEGASLITSLRDVKDLMTSTMDLMSDYIDKIYQLNEDELLVFELFVGVDWQAKIEAGDGIRKKKLTEKIICQKTRFSASQVKSILGSLFLYGLLKKSDNPQEWYNIKYEC